MEFSLTLDFGCLSVLVFFLSLWGGWQVGPGVFVAGGGWAQQGQTYLPYPWMKEAGREARPLRPSCRGLELGSQSAYSIVTNCRLDSDFCDLSPMSLECGMKASWFPKDQGPLLYFRYWELLIVIWRMAVASVTGIRSTPSECSVNPKNTLSTRPDTGVDRLAWFFLGLKITRWNLCEGPERDRRLHEFQDRW